MRLTVALLAAFFASALSVSAGPLPTPVVLAEESVYTFVSPDNGSGPLWSFGCTSIVRSGDEVIVSEMETGEGVPRLCNTRWRLLQRTDDGWKMFQEAEGYRQREPCSIGVSAEGELFLYANDSLHPPGAEYLDCEPHLLRFSLRDKATPPVKLSPVWNIESPYFTDHSYRGYGVDGPRGEALMLNIDANTSIQHWAHLDRAGKTLANGAITFPIRSCYPQVALKDRSAHVLVIGDIVEPVEAWRAFKSEQTGQKWDYVFRILYYTWTPDTLATPFAEPIEIANVDDTAGHIRNEDLWVAPDGAAYLLYHETEVHTPMMRDKFFPDKTVGYRLHLAVVRDGVVAERHVLQPDTISPGAGFGRFHETPDGRVYAVVYLANEDPGNYLLPIYPQVDPHAKVKIPLQKPISAFSLAGVRSGTAPSNTIDILGYGGNSDMVYAQVELR
ncbi:MAG: hypothetical protein KF886_02180 [Candidatus Hydrogenedentes bacterium]|nr:hypothetical protein [Candidatus Hydrogenedentota bacterium]